MCPHSAPRLGRLRRRICSGGDRGADRYLMVLGRRASGVDVGGDRCVDSGSRSPRKGMPRYCGSGEREDRFLLNAAAHHPASTDRNHQPTSRRSRIRRCLRDAARLVRGSLGRQHPRRAALRSLRERGCGGCTRVSRLTTSQHALECASFCRLDVTPLSAGTGGLGRSRAITSVLLTQARSLT